MHPKLLYFRYKLFQYRHVERVLAERIGTGRFLDIGCGDGENLLRFDDLPLARVGLEVSWPRLQKACAANLPVLQATGTALPLPDGTFDLIYIAHVLHHVADFEQVWSEIRRCLADDGSVFVVETVTDNPLLRFGRSLHPSWQGDSVEADWSYASLRRIVEEQGFSIEKTGRYNLLFWLWEALPLAFWPLEIFSPLFIYLDLFLARFWHRYSVHCFFVLRRQQPFDRTPLLST